MALADPKKAKIIHVLRDGTVLDNIEGHVIQLEDPEPLIQIFVSISKRRRMNARRGGENGNHDEEMDSVTSIIDEGI